ncbi:DUF4192 domain-containing protein [Arthrobacter gandavensis]|uniref:DUF4192 domain-containing protein n=1 Tax=Arthrobacter gandavensis TaxID=169960 RepID=UPI00188EFD4B|nr:DUF4192 domain-containing protein [Arthrobacter gandavensis]MBF4994898.1 DUF4192 domain-containing protein [Arthrobacter gandavensis]
MNESQKAGHASGGARPGRRRPDRPAAAGRGGPAPDTSGAGMPEVLRAGTPQDILAFVPHSLGFQPQESLVLLGLRGTRLGATLRLDLPGASCSGDSPGPDSLELLSGYVSRAASLLSHDADTDGVLAVLFTDLPLAEGGPPPYSALMEMLGRELEENGLVLRDAWLTGNGSWRAYFCTDAACCPWPGHPADRITESRLSAELVYRGSAYAPSPGGSLDGPLHVAGILRTAALDQRVEEVRRRMEGTWGAPGVFDEVLAAWDRRICSTPRQVPPASDVPYPGHDGLERDALLLASLESKPVRDTVLVLAASGLAAAANGVRQWLHPAPESMPATGSADQSAPALAGQQFRSILIGRSRTAPDWERLDRTHSVFSDLLQRAAGEPAAALLTLLGWVEWARGRSSRAEVCLSAALREEPGYRLAALLRELLRRGELPQWALSPLTAWRGGPRT